MPTEKPQKSAPKQAAVGDDWTRVFPPPKARISDTYASGERWWRKLMIALACIGFAGIAAAMLTYAIRVPAGQRPPSEPTRAEQRVREAEEMLRQRGMETQPFQKAQEEKARRRREIEERNKAGAGKPQ